MAIQIIGEERDLPGCVKAPILLQEVVRACSEGNSLKDPVMTLMSIFAEMAQTAVELDDPCLKYFSLRLGLFNLPNEDLKKAIEYEAYWVRKQLNAKKVIQDSTKESDDEHKDEDQKAEAKGE